LVAIGTGMGLSMSQIEANDTYKLEMKTNDDKLKKQFPMWDSSNAQGESNFFNKMMQIKEMVLDPKIASTPAGKALQIYWKQRESLIADVTASNPLLANDAWQESNDGIPTRQRLTENAEKLLKKYPEFAGLWDNVLSKEFEAVETGK